MVYLLMNFNNCCPQYESANFDNDSFCISDNESGTHRECNWERITSAAKFIT